MAIYHSVPAAAPHIRDLVTLNEAVALFGETGRPAAKSTLRSWITKRGICTQRSGGRVLVSYSDLLEAHRDAQLSRDS
ncbi:hypothetical protein [Streptomyces sp. NPDC058657]|uniref:hypothetical protein n=1 Tax=unclassified Streptomyces TaxID=2593676 RepID=UPI0036550509